MNYFREKFSDSRLIVRNKYLFEVFRFLFCPLSIVLKNWCTKLARWNCQVCATKENCPHKLILCNFLLLFWNILFDKLAVNLSFDVTRCLSDYFKYLRRFYFGLHLPCLIISDFFEILKKINSLRFFKKISSFSS